jgi:hypothetical protein
MLQIVEEAEREGVLADLERDILLNDLREAYAELKFGEKEEESGHIADTSHVVPTTPIEEAKSEPEINDDVEEEPEVEVELIFDEEAEGDSEEIEDRSEEIEENPSTLNSQLSTPEESAAVAEPVAESETLSTLNSQLSTPKRSPLFSLYEDEPTPVLGEQFHEAPSVADTIACPKGVAESAPVVSLREAIGVADKFMLVRELFGGDADEYERAINALDSQPSFDDCIIYISENYVWSPNSQATKFVMELLNRKYS